MARTPRVALLVETDRGYGRAVLWGIAAYVREHGPWRLYLEPGPTDRTYDFTGWQGDGIIAQCYGDHHTRAVREVGVPTVSVSVAEPDYADAYVLMDDAAIGRAAAHHLLDQGFTEFAYSGLENSCHSERRGPAFADAVREAGFACHTYAHAHGQKVLLQIQEEEADLAAWLRGLPKPIGVMAADDLGGRHMVEVCDHAGLRVPDDVAIIGVAHDRLLCELSLPTLSSVDVAGNHIGYRAAQELDRLMRRRAPAKRRRPLLVEPAGVVARRSTDVLAIDDPVLLAAVQYIRARPSEPLRVEDVVDHVAVARRSLERRFKHRLRRTILAEINRCHVEEAKRLLRETDLQMPEVADRAGFRRPERLSEIFKRETGVSPSDFRRRRRLR